MYHEVVYGHAAVRQIFTAGRTSIAGSYVTDGRITRNSTIRVVRGDEVIWTGSIASLKRFKDDVREVASGSNSVWCWTASTTSKKPTPSRPLVRRGRLSNKRPHSPAYREGSSSKWMHDGRAAWPKRYRDFSAL